MKLLKANKGIRLPHLKDTFDAPIEDFDKPQRVYIPLGMKKTDFEVYVNPGDQVKLGQKVSKSLQGFPFYHHASVSGTVVGIERVTGHLGKPVQAIVIENDYQDTVTDEYQPIMDLEQLSREDIVERLLEGGFVGLGGAGFPTHLKYRDVDNIDTVILNGAECEPAVTSDYRAMLEHAAEIVDGLTILMRAVDAPNGIIAIKEKYTEVAKAFHDVLGDYPNIQLKYLPDLYPTGWEKSVVYRTTKRRYERLPKECGVIVNNVQTALYVSRFFRKGIPLVERIVTVTGDGIQQKKNLRIRIGTLAKELIDYCGGFNNEFQELRLVCGGPMMGETHKDTSFIMAKEVNGLVVLPGVKQYEDVKGHASFSDLWNMWKDLLRQSFGEADVRVVDEQPCVRCMKCVESCPVGLRPTLLSTASLHRDEEQLAKFNVLACINCGICTYVCPSHIPLAANIQRGQNYYRAKQRMQNR